MAAARVGIVGAGVISGAHAGAVIKTPSATLVAVCDPDMERARKVAAAHGAPAVFDSLEAMLASSNLEAVVLATPNHLHPTQALQCAAAHCHVLCEKPLANSYAEALQVQRAFVDAGLVLRTGFNQRFLNHIKLAKVAIERGIVGEVHAFRSVFSGKWDNYFDSTNFRFNPEQSGGTTINDNLIHRYDMIRYLLSDEYLSVVAELSHSVIPPVVDDNVHLLVSMRQGARGTFSADRYSPVIADSTELYGTKGSIHFVTNAVSPFNAVPLAIFTTVDPASVPAELRDAQFPLARARHNPGWSGWMSFWPAFNDTYAEQFKDFVAATRGEVGGKTAATGEDGVRSTELIQAAYSSQIERRWVELPLTEREPYRIPKYEDMGAR